MKSKIQLNIEISSDLELEDFKNKYIKELTNLKSTFNNLGVAEIAAPTFINLQRKEVEIKIIRDENAQTPDDWGDENVFLVYDHRSFTVERKYFEPSDIAEYLQAKRWLSKFEAGEIKEEYEDEKEYWEELASNPYEHHIFPVFAYIHSGTSLSLRRDEYPFTCQWDTSCSGFCLVSKKEFEEEEKAFGAAKALTDEWNCYLSGDVWGYEINEVVRDENDEIIDETFVDSCWGFYGLEHIQEEVDGFKKTYEKVNYKVTIKTEY